MDQMMCLVCPSIFILQITNEPRLQIHQTCIRHSGRFRKMFRVSIVAMIGFKSLFLCSFVNVFLVWFLGEPESAQGTANEDCAAFYQPLSFHWVDADCNAAFQPVCEKRFAYTIFNILNCLFVLLSNVQFQKVIGIHCVRCFLLLKNFKSSIVI